MSGNVYFSVVFISYYRQYLWLKVQFYLISLGLYMKLCELLLPVQNMHMSHIIWKMYITLRNGKIYGNMIWALYVVMFYIHIS